MNDYLGIENQTESDIIDGVLWLKGHPIPYKGIPYKECIEWANEAKQALKLGMFLELPEKLLPIRYTKASQAAYSIAKQFVGEKKAKTIANIIEFDQAYRFRLQDLANETGVENLTNKPIKEIWRLFGILKKRDRSERIYGTMGKKFWFFVMLASIALLLLDVRNKVKKAAEYLDDLKFDENDLYWTSLKEDYNYGL